VDGKPGGELGDTELIRGIVIDKEMSHPQMPKDIKVCAHMVYVHVHVCLLLYIVYRCVYPCTSCHTTQLPYSITSLFDCTHLPD
jgi:hypothetical protein